ncbi:MAG: KH domain-containing protein [Clostridia bacterium]|nr:KH domain-containing protein [Clostridia bacterium]
MKELLEMIIKSLVADAESVSINEVQNEKTITYEVKVAKNDMGKVIGREGKIAKAIRTVIKAIASKEEKQVTVEFID